MFQVCAQDYSIIVESKDKTMKVQINNKTVTLFNGARVIDALRAYYSQQDIPLPESLPCVTDAYGNTVAPSGALSCHSKLFIQCITHKQKQRK